MNRRGFTLTEMLVVMAIIAVLAAVLFPVFQAAKASAKQVSCLENFRQVQASMMLYLGDYDDHFMPISYDPGSESNSKKDRTWVQLLLPYTRNFSSFLCPGASDQSFNYNASFDQDLVPGDLFSRYYRASLHVNTGLNYLALSPSVAMNGRWQAMPRVFSQIASPSSTIMVVDSAWGVNAAGTPYGGGNWVVEPPCRYESTLHGLVDLFQIDGYSFGDVLAFSDGWSGFGTGTLPYGGAWPWHSSHMNIVRVDGSAKSVTPTELANGCNPQRGWMGSVFDGSSYNWAPSGY